MASTYLTRTPSSAGNRKTWTWSSWIKTATTSGDKGIFSASTDSSNRNAINLSNEGYFIFDYEVGGTRNILSSQNATYKDISGWYHLVVAVDTTQATDTDRVKIYVNGSQITLTGVINDYPSQNDNMFVNNTVSHSIGRQDWGTSYFDGSMSHVHFIDGTAYDASAFGETDATTGEWKIKTSPSVTYGTNGFALFTSDATGTDTSGNSNDFTISGTLTATQDSPSNVFCTMNPNNTTSNVSLSNGNTSVSLNGAYTTYGTIQVTKGKFYWEQKINGSSLFASVADGNAGSMKTVGLLNENYAWAYRSDGNKQTGGTATSWGNSFTTNDIISTALDMDNGKIYWAKNGVWQESGNPATGANPAFTGLNTSSYAPDGLTPCVGQYSGDQNTSFNFGNGYFGTTAVSSAGTNASGNGIFEYDVPAGYTALSTKGLNL